MHVVFEFSSFCWNYIMTSCMLMASSYAGAFSLLQTYVIWKQIGFTHICHCIVVLSSTLMWNYVFHRRSLHITGCFVTPLCTCMHMWICLFVLWLITKVTKPSYAMCWASFSQYVEAFVEKCNSCCCFLVFESWK